VVLDPECRWQWLDPELSDRDTIRKVARRLDPDRLIRLSGVDPGQPAGER
jgi:hypothetical protein